MEGRTHKLHPQTQAPPTNQHKEAGGGVEGATREFGSLKREEEEEQEQEQEQEQQQQIHL